MLCRRTRAGSTSPRADRDRLWLRRHCEALARVRLMNALPVALALGLSGGGAALACTPPESFRFEVSHETFGALGYHDIGFRCEAGRLIVETRARIEVRVLLVPMFRRDLHYVEVWQGDQLLAFDALTIDDGEDRFVVHARLEDGRMVIEGPGGRVEGPPEVVPSHPWNPAVLERGKMFDVVDGVLLEVETRPAGEAYLKLEGEPVRARKYVMSGAAEQELWYAEDGRWLQWRLERQGTVTLRRE